MFRWRQVSLLLGVLLVVPPAHAGRQSTLTYEITLERALDLARRRGPALASAGGRINEARGDLEGASALRFNPQLGASVGPRIRGASTQIDWEVRANQWLELGGQRQDRIAVATARIDAAEAQRKDVERLLLRDVGLKFIHALYWKRRVELVQESLRIAEDIARTARRRHEVGDSGGLEESVALLALVRSQMNEVRAKAVLGELESDLKVLLGLEANSALVLKGDLQNLGTRVEPPPNIADERADLRVLTAELNAAKAKAELGRDARIPNLAIGASYAQEEGADIVMGSIALSLPIFNHEQGATAVAEARSGRIETELVNARHRAAIEVESANHRSLRLSDAARQFEERGLATLNRSERLAKASYEAGAIPLGELLALRRELVQAKLDYAELLLAAAVAKIEFTASAGGWK